MCGGWLASRMGSEFLPSLDEGDIALHALRIPGTSLTQAIGMQEQLEAAVREFPEVRTSWPRSARPKSPPIPMPPSVADNFIILKDRRMAGSAQAQDGRWSRSWKRAVRVIPGNNYEFTQPIQMRFNELLSGVRADVAVKVYGDDLEQLAAIGEAWNAIVAAVAGAHRRQALEQVTGLPVLSVKPRATPWRATGSMCRMCRTRVHDASTAALPWGSVRRRPAS
jgi:cobalt-zinc-cadmium resistance protein CzcA